MVLLSSGTWRVKDARTVVSGENVEDERKLRLRCFPRVAVAFDFLICSLFSFFRRFSWGPLFLRIVLRQLNCVDLTACVRHAANIRQACHCALRDLDVLFRHVRRETVRAMLCFPDIR